MQKIATEMWVPNSERGHKMLSLEGENEIPHIPKLDFLTFFDFLPVWVELIRKQGMDFENWLPSTQYISEPTAVTSILKNAF